MKYTTSKSIPISNSHLHDFIQLLIHQFRAFGNPPLVHNAARRASIILVFGQGRGTGVGGEVARIVGGLGGAELRE